LKLHTLATLLALSWVIDASAAADSAQGYRLAGIIAAGQGHVGLLELPQGGQILVRVGSSLPGGARVLALSDGELALVLPSGQRVTLALSGMLGGSTVNLSRTASRNLEANPRPAIVATIHRAPNHSVREVAAASFRESLRAPVAATGNATEKPNSAVVVQRFATLLELPAGARILEVNGQPVATAAAAVNITDRALAAGNQAIINVQSDRGFERIYLQPETGRP
jgi:hypothetical protein